MSGTVTRMAVLGDSPAGLAAPALTGIRRLSALDTVRARIALAVDLGLLTPGERLPTNSEIARALGVGEITVRRALVSLCDDGCSNAVAAVPAAPWSPNGPPAAACARWPRTPKPPTRSGS